MTINKPPLQFLKFLLAGALGACFYILGSYMLTSKGLEPWVASLIVYLSLVPIIYLIQKKFVFESYKSHYVAFFRYLCIQLFGLGISAFLPFKMTNIGINPVVSFFSVALLNSFASYALQLYWAFSKNNKTEK
jgi:putative flippase GtrA